MTTTNSKTGIKVVLWHGTTQEEHVVSNYLQAMNLIDERHQNRHDPAFYDIATGERLHDNGSGLSTEDGEQVH